MKLSLRQLLWAKWQDIDAPTPRLTSGAMLPILPSLVSGEEWAWIRQETNGICRLYFRLYFRLLSVCISVSISQSTAARA